jgi:TrmH family RNA methyltransferase
VVEGARLVEEALHSGVLIEAVFEDAAAAGPAEHQLAQACTQIGAERHQLQPGVLARASATVAPQPVAAIVACVDVPLADLGALQPDLVVVCAEVRDPGNLGTIVRSAAAAGAGAVICCAGSVDIYNPKSVRATAGALFHLPVVAGPDAEETLQAMGRWQLRRWGLSAGRGEVYSEVNLATPTALVLGNEAAGLPPSLEVHLDGALQVPMAGGVESLNVATTAAVVCFEAARQRRQARRGL